MAGKYVCIVAAALVLGVTGCGDDENLSDATTSLSPSVVATTEGESSFVPTTVVLPPGTAPTTAPAAPQPLPETVAQPPASTTVPSEGQADCQAVLGGWNTAPDGTGTTMAPAQIVSVRVGQHDCFDRVVIDIATTGPVGSQVRYVDVVHQDGSGFPVPVAGGAALQVVVYAPAYELIDSGAPYQYGASEFTQWGSLREVAWAGSFEGMTTFAIGTVAQNAFAVTTWEEHGIRKVIIDIAH